MDVMAKVNEAEVYISMGLFEEGRMVYEQIHSSAEALDDSILQNIASKISELENEIDHLEQNKHNSVSEKEVVFFKEALSITDESPEILNTANAFMEMGLFREALHEYGKLLGRDREWKDIIPNTTECLLKCCPSDEMLDFVDKITSDKKFDDNKKAEIKSSIGQELEKKNLEALALKFHHSIHRHSNHRLDHPINTTNKRLKSLSSIPRLLTTFASISMLAILFYFVANFFQIYFIFYFFSYWKNC